MSKFKIGDIVKCIDFCGSTGIALKEKGSIFLIEGIKESREDGWDLLTLKDFNLEAFENRFELTTEEEMKEKSANPNASEDASERQVGGSHYAKLAIQPFTYAFHNNLNCGQFNALKYITRYKDKNGIEDLRKAIHCIELLIEHESASDQRSFEHEEEQNNG